MMTQMTQINQLTRITRFTRVLLGLMCVVTLSACQSDNPGLTGPLPPPQAPEQFQTNEQNATPFVKRFDPRVDILFVIDDSNSMRRHQVNLSRNINRFIEQFSKIKAIDFHIAYTFTHDRIRYRPDVVPAVCGPNTEAAVRGRVNWNEPGTLQPLIGLEGRRYVTRTDNFVQVLGQTFDPEKNPALVKNIFKPRDPNKCASGAEYEELFTPLLGTLTNPLLTENKDFRRPGAFFVAILVSDAKDESGMTAEQVYQRMVRVLNDAKLETNRFRVFAVAMKPGTVIGTDTPGYKDGSCVPDPAWAERSVTDPDSGETRHSWPRSYQIRPEDNPLANLANLTQDEGQARDSQVLSICDPNFGDALAKFGEQIKQDTLHDMIIDLKDVRPRVFLDPQHQDKNLRVFLGEREIPAKFWKYHSQSNSIVLKSGSVHWTEDDQIRVQYVPVKQPLKAIWN